MPLKRTEHWATREFHQFLLARARMPFAWGSNDCCLFPADAILAFTGVDLAADFRVKGDASPKADFSYRPGDYHDEASAFALIHSVTGGTTAGDAAAYCAAKHGLAEWKSPLLAKRGDLVVLSQKGQLIAGVVHLNGRHVVTVGETGLLRLPIRSVTRAWAV